MGMITIVFSDTILDFYEWTTNFYGTLAEVFIFVVLTWALAWFLEKQVPTFLALTACPPHVNEENMNLLFDVLFNDHPLYNLPGLRRGPAGAVHNDDATTPSTTPGLMRNAPLFKRSAPSLARAHTLPDQASYQAQLNVSAAVSAAALELADLLGKREQLEQRLQDLAGEVAVEV